MATELEANIAVLFALASLGFGWILAVLGIIAARRVESKKLSWVSAGFFLLGLQGGIFFWRVIDDPETASDVLVQAIVGLVALATFYYAVYRRD